MTATMKIQGADELRATFAAAAASMDAKAVELTRFYGKELKAIAVSLIPKHMEDQEHTPGNPDNETPWSRSGSYRSNMRLTYTRIDGAFCAVLGNSSKQTLWLEFGDSHAPPYPHFGPAFREIRGPYATAIEALGLGAFGA